MIWQTALGRPPDTRNGTPPIAPGECRSHPILDPSRLNVPVPFECSAKPKPSKPGPAAELFKIENMPFKAAIKKSFQKKKPAGGWPK